ncbi:MAG: tetratricopeptide repeat protein, partial [Spirochaetota bacterium]|nr:tetratricopeptide repeat protein [Spirochaetota bacterium]
MIKSRTNKYFNNAIEAISKGRYRSGQKWLKVAGFFGYSTMDIYFQKGVIAFENLNLGEALRFFHSYLSLAVKPEQSVYYYLGEAYHLLGNTKEAIRHFKYAFDRGSDKLIQCKALIYLENLKYYSSDKVQELFENKLRFIWNQDRADMEQYRIQALTETLKGNYNKAIELFLEVIRANPDAIEPYKELAECYARVKEFDEIIKLFNSKSNIVKKDKTVSLFLA